MFQIQFFVANQSENSAWCSNDNMRICVFQLFFILLDWQTSEENGNLKPGKETDRHKYENANRWTRFERTFIDGIYFEKRSYSLLIWKANSRVWHITNT